MFIKWFRALRAKHYGVPAELVDFWAPAYLRIGATLPEGVFLAATTFEDISAAPCQLELAPRVVGELVPVFITDSPSNIGRVTHRHFYEITAIRVSQGEHHAFDPRHFNMRYSHTESSI